MLGLDNAGKTSILYKMCLGETILTVPTVGFNLETIENENLKLYIWDIGGQTSIRGYWESYFFQTDLLIFVIDYSDHDRFELAKLELMKLEASEFLKNANILILANKADKPNCMSLEEVSSILDQVLHHEKRNWAIFETSAINNKGIQESLQWILQNIDL